MMFLGSIQKPVQSPTNKSNTDANGKVHFLIFQDLLQKKRTNKSGLFQPSDVISQEVFRQLLIALDCHVITWVNQFYSYIYICMLYLIFCRPLSNCCKSRLFHTGLFFLKYYLRCMVRDWSCLYVNQVLFLSSRQFFDTVNQRCVSRRAAALLSIEPSFGQYVYTKGELQVPCPKQ